MNDERIRYYCKQLYNSPSPIHPAILRQLIEEAAGKHLGYGVLDSSNSLSWHGNTAEQAKDYVKECGHVYHLPRVVSLYAREIEG